jgi:hypothetical protein
MAREIINVGAAPNDGQGDPIRTAFIKTNNNFGELYSKIQPVPPVALTGSVGDVAGMTAYDQEYYYYCFENYDGTSIIWRQVPNAAQANVVALSATGNVTADYIFGDGTYLTNVVAGAGTELINGNTNITTATNGNANITISGSANIAVFTTAGLDINGTITGNTVSVTGNVTSGNISAVGLISGNTMSVIGNVTGGNISAVGNINGNRYINLPNGFITLPGGTIGNNYNSRGYISATGNITGGNVLTAGRVSAVGNVSGAYIIGDGGLLSNVTVTSNVAVTQIANGTSILSVNGSGGNILVNVNGISNVAQFVPNGIEVTGNVNSANVYLTGRFVSAGNVTGANLLATNNVVATGNVNGTHVNSDLTMSAVGNIQAGNLRTAGTVSATGNVTGNYFIGNGSQLTDITSSYGNSNVGLYLASYSGNITAAIFSATGNVTGGNVLTAGVVSATGNVTGGNVLTAGVVSATGNVFGNIVSATGNVNAANIYLTGQQVVVGNITGSNLNATTDISASGNVKAGGVTSYSFVSATGNVIGSYFVGTATSAQYADVAENYTSDNNYEPGTVLEFGGSAEVTLATDETPRVAGVVSTLPAHLMNSMLTSEYTVAVALLGRVPCKVQGPIAKGDMLISAGGGYARAKQNPIMGTVIGKALEDLPDNHGVIEVVVGRL